MVRKSLIAVFLIAVVYICIQLFLRPLLVKTPYIIQTISIFYLWSPGIVALVCASRENQKLAIFAKPTATFWLIPLYTLIICLLAFLATIPFGAGAAINPAFVDQSVAKKIGFFILFFFSGYLLLAVLFSFIFLGGELYWRGYLWDNLKSRGALKAIFLIALVWSVWQIPVTGMAYTPGLPTAFLNIGFTFVINFAMAPVLTYFRVKGKSILAAAIGYSSLLSAYLFYLIIFPSGDPRVFGVYGGFTIAFAVVFSLLFKLYSPSHWDKLLQKES